MFYTYKVIKYATPPSHITYKSKGTLLQTKKPDTHKMSESCTLNAGQVPLQSVKTCGDSSLQELYTDKPTNPVVTHIKPHSKFNCRSIIITSFE